MNLLSLTAVELGKKIKAHEVTVEEATRAALDAIHQKEEKIKHLVVLYHLNNLKNDEIIANGF